MTDIHLTLRRDPLASNLTGVSYTHEDDEGCALDECFLMLEQFEALGRPEEIYVTVSTKALA